MIVFWSLCNTTVGLSGSLLCASLASPYMGMSQRALVVYTPLSTPSHFPHCALHCLLGGCRQYVNHGLLLLTQMLTGLLSQSQIAPAQVYHDRQNSLAADSMAPMPVILYDCSVVTTPAEWAGSAQHSMQDTRQAVAYMDARMHGIRVVQVKLSLGCSALCSSLFMMVVLAWCQCKVALDFGF